jgi:hypothetical protein
VNIQLLCQDLEERGVTLQANGDELLVNALVRELANTDKAALARFNARAFRVPVRRG